MQGERRQGAGAGISTDMKIARDYVQALEPTPTCASSSLSHVKMIAKLQRSVRGFGEVTSHELKDRLLTSSIAVLERPDAKWGWPSGKEKAIDQLLNFNNITGDLRKNTVMDALRADLKLESSQYNFSINQEQILSRYGKSKNYGSRATVNAYRALILSRMVKPELFDKSNEALLTSLVRKLYDNALIDIRQMSLPEDSANELARAVVADVLQRSEGLEDTEVAKINEIIESNFNEVIENNSDVISDTVLVQAWERGIENGLDFSDTNFGDPDTKDLSAQAQAPAELPATAQEKPPEQVFMSFEELAAQLARSANAIGLTDPKTRVEELVENLDARISEVHRDAVQSVLSNDAEVKGSVMGNSGFWEQRLKWADQKAAVEETGRQLGSKTRFNLEKAGYTAAAGEQTGVAQKLGTSNIAKYKIGQLITGGPIRGEITAICAHTTGATSGPGVLTVQMPAAEVNAQAQVQASAPGPAEPAEPAAAQAAREQAAQVAQAAAKHAARVARTPEELHGKIDVISADDGILEGAGTWWSPGRWVSVQPQGCLALILAIGVQDPSADTVAGADTDAGEKIAVLYCKDVPKSLSRKKEGDTGFEECVGKWLTIENNNCNLIVAEHNSVNGKQFTVLQAAAAQETAAQEAAAQEAADQAEAQAIFAATDYSLDTDDRSDYENIYKMIGNLSCFDIAPDVIKDAKKRLIDGAKAMFSQNNDFQGPGERALDHKREEAQAKLTMNRRMFRLEKQKAISSPMFKPAQRRSRRVTFESPTPPSRVKVK